MDYILKLRGKNQYKVSQTFGPIHKSHTQELQREYSQD